MSTDIYDDEGLIVTKKAGPSNEGADRARWQITTPSDCGHVTLDRKQAIALTRALVDSVYAPPNPHGE